MSEWMTPDYHSHSCLAMGPGAIRDELSSLISFPDGDSELEELAKWWATRCEDDLHWLADDVMQADIIWNVWRSELIDSMKNVKQEIEASKQ